MKLVSWNVNGIRAAVGKGFYDFFKDIDADIFSLQETKLQENQVDDELKKIREYQYWNYSEKLKKYYQAVRAGGLGDISEGGYQRSTHYIKDNGKDFELTDILDTKKQRKFCFAGKLAAPYIVPLHTSEQA